jgi:dienelactone hydrolase
MNATATGRVTSADGTTIVFDQSGGGPAVILVHGAFTGRAHPILSAVAAAGGSALVPELLAFFTA